MGPGTGSTSELAFTVKPNIENCTDSVERTVVHAGGCVVPQLKGATWLTPPLLKSTTANMLPMPAGRPIRVMLNVSLQHGGGVSNGSFILKLDVRDSPEGSGATPRGVLYAPLTRNSPS